MFYDKRFEAALETIAEAEQAEMTAGLDAGTDDLAADLGGDAGTPGGTGTVGPEAELAGDLGADAGTGAGAPAAAPEPGGAEAEGALLATPPGKRSDTKSYEVKKNGKTYSTSDNEKGKLTPKKPFDERPAGKRRQHFKQKKEFGTTRSSLPGMNDFKGLVNMSSVYEDKKTNYKVEERKILKEQRELDALFKSLKERDKKNETEAQ